MTPPKTLNYETIDGQQVATEPDISHLVIEDDTPVDNFHSAQQQRLLVEVLYSNAVLPSPFIAEANVGLFYEFKGEPPIVPDVLLSLGVQRAADYAKRSDRSYFVWEFQKLPEVCVEIVSNRDGDEVGLSKRSQQKGKKDIYAQIGIPYYVVFDPLSELQDEDEMDGALIRVWGSTETDYQELTSTEGLKEPGQFVWLGGIGIGLMLWEGKFEEDVTRLWLRWCDRDGNPIPTGAEGQAIERQRADAEQQRAERLAERLRAMGIDPNTV